MVNMNVHQSLLDLTRIGIGHSYGKLSYDIDWPSLSALTIRQGLPAVVIDAIEEIPEEAKPQLPLLCKWIGFVIQDYEHRYEQYKEAILELAGFYRSHGFKMMVLKGYACNLDWPKPNRRPCGDIDIWLFGQQKEADAVLARERNIKIDSSHHHHTVFSWRAFTVENHYDFVNVHDYKSSVELEKIFKELGIDDSYYVEEHGEKIYLPSPYLHALFMLRHLVSHFASTSIVLRQVLDWAFFIERHNKEIDWDWLLSVLEKYHMSDFFNCINAICVEDLGFDANLFPVVRHLPDIKEKVLDDIMSPKYGAAEPKSLLRRLWYKYHRWRGNAWKRELCYNESEISALVKGLWAHLLKPSSI